MAEHRWAAVVIAGLDDEQAAADFAALDIFDRLERVASLASDVGAIRAVRGPICSECRVAWDDVHAQKDPWPCPGRRPKALGGQLVPPERRITRQQARAQRREATKAEAAKERLAREAGAALARARSTPADPQRSTLSTSP